MPSVPAFPRLRLTAGLGLGGLTGPAARSAAEWPQERTLGCRVAAGAHASVTALHTKHPSRGGCPRPREPLGQTQWVSLWEIKDVHRRGGPTKKTTQATVRAECVPPQTPS